MPGWTLLVVPIGVGCAAIVALGITAISARFMRRIFQSAASPEPCPGSGTHPADEVATREVLRTRPDGQIAVRHIEIEPLDEQGPSET